MEGSGRDLICYSTATCSWRDENIYEKPEAGRYFSRKIFQGDPMNMQRKR